MTITSIGSIGTVGSAVANQASTILTLTAAAEAGNAIVLSIGVDNFNTVDGSEVATNVTDSAGNSWSTGQQFTNGQGAAQAGAHCAVWFCNVVTTIPIGGTITVTFNNATSRDASAVSAWEFGLTAGSTLKVVGSATLANDNLDPASLNVTPTANITALRFRAIASETNSNTALTPTASWTAIAGARSGAGTAASNMTIRGEFRIFQGTGAASNPTYVAADHASVYVVFAEERKLIAAHGIYALTGQAVGLRKGRTMPAAQGGYSLSGQVALFTYSLSLGAETGFYSLMGQFVPPSIPADTEFAVGVLPIAAFPVAGEALPGFTVLEIEMQADAGSYSLNGQAVGLKRGLQIAAAQGSYSLSGQAALFRAGRRGIAEAGTYNLTGQTALLARTRSFVAETGLYAYTGHPSLGFLHARGFEAESGSYSLSGQAVGTLADIFRLGVAVWSVAEFTVAGTDLSAQIVPPSTYLMPAAFGSYSLSGQTVTLRRGYSLDAATGFYTIVGSEAVADYTLVVDAGSYALSGQAINLVYDAGAIITLDTGLYSLSGQAALFVAPKRLIAEFGSYTLNGQASVLSWDSLQIGVAVSAVAGAPVAGGSLPGQFVVPSTFTVTANQGTYALTGQTAGLRHGFVLDAATGFYSWTGAEAVADYEFVLDTGLYALSGQPVGLTKLGTPTFMLADQGAYALTGQAIAIRADRRIAAAVGSYMVNGQAAEFEAAQSIPAETGLYSLSGQPAAFALDFSIPLAQGSYGLTGQAVAFTRARSIPAESGSYSLSGLSAGLVYSADPGGAGGGVLRNRPMLEHVGRMGAV